MGVVALPLSLVVLLLLTLLLLATKSPPNFAGPANGDCRFPPPTCAAVAADPAPATTAAAAVDGLP